MWTLDGANRFWTRDEEIHVSADVAYGVLTYVERDRRSRLPGRLRRPGAVRDQPVLGERVEEGPETGRYSLRQVMGPDEFHSHVDNNTFTNRLAQWHLEQAVRVHQDLAENHPEALKRIETEIGLKPDEVRRWGEVAEGLVILFDPDRELIEQFEGYFLRKDVAITEWDANNMPKYPEGYHHFNCEETQLLKQPDVVVLMYLMPDDFSMPVKLANFEYYEARTLHKSSLSPAIHAIMGIEVGDARRALEYFYRSALVDLADNQGNTHEGMHIASAGGTWQALVNGFGGVRVHHNQLTLNPWLPEQWQQITFRLQWRGNSIDLAIGHDEATVCLNAAEGATEEILLKGQPLTLKANQPATVSLAETAAAR